MHPATKGVNGYGVYPEAAVLVVFLALVRALIKQLAALSRRIPPLMNLPMAAGPMKQHLPPRRRLVLDGLAAALAGPAFAGRDLVADGGAVSLDHARAEFEAGRAILIDIREPDEHATGVVAGAMLRPMRQLGQRLAEIPTDSSRPVLLICRTQYRSSATLRALRKHGYRHVRYMHGGMSEWARRGWPMVRPGG